MTKQKKPFLGITGWAIITLWQPTRSLYRSIRHWLTDRHIYTTHKSQKESSNKTSEAAAQHTAPRYRCPPISPSCWCCCCACCYYINSGLLCFLTVFLYLFRIPVSPLYLIIKCWQSVANGNPLVNKTENPNEIIILKKKYAGILPFKVQCI